MSATTFFQFLVLSSFILASFFGVEGKIPDACKKYECPSYEVTEVGKDYEIRRYDSPVWISNSRQDKSLVTATIKGFARLVNYVQGDNKDKKEIKMTAPVTSEILSGNSSIVVSFFVPKENQKNPIPADDLTVQRWPASSVAVRQFYGSVKDSDVLPEVAALKASLAGTKWANTPYKSFLVAQYNAPFELFNLVNEIWLLYE
ncbi:hypothetical protein PHAVU_003G030800 [Phaseolus vulgaris]|uniref:Heme-binding protein 2 n=1 Tax=Phaseolus vulgaris TaxID=3885 RepID=V7C8Y6_PHAVU|nr:hypothetical protein PHAVU_003G030800g [Phaseolus vulgaris]ESW25381.1 hypothetical protein PHAVU_003G030800g [Phaseolus vulgaris]